MGPARRSTNQAMDANGQADGGKAMFRLTGGIATPPAARCAGLVDKLVLASEGRPRHPPAPR
jgi:hypothetical protein